MPTVTESLRSFLRARRTTHNGPDLLDRWTPGMETQVNVAAGKGEPVAGKRNTFTDGIDEWWNIRIPKNAHAEPEFRDYEMTWPLDLHADAIGCTGWDWQARRSRWIGFDFDSITGHAAGIGVTDEQLAEVRRAAENLPYVEARRSTGGNGLHLYVYFDEKGIPTSNHTEHAALARAVLGMMSGETRFDFASQIDSCGGLLWIWARKMTPKNRGLELLGAAEKVLSVTDLPANWRDHVDVVTRRRAKVRVQAVAEEHLDPFEVLASSYTAIALDDKHKAVIDELTRSGFSTVWTTDHHLLQTHTKALANLIDDPEKRRELGLKGIFRTISEGNDPATPNCFMFPMFDGAWRVYRFSPGITEAETWEQDGEGWTCCHFNRLPDLPVAARAAGGAELSDGTFQFDRARDALKAAEALGEKLELDERWLDREAKLKRNKKGQLVVLIKHQEGKNRQNRSTDPLEKWRKQGAEIKKTDDDRVLVMLDGVEMEVLGKPDLEPGPDLDPETHQKPGEGWAKGRGWWEHVCNVRTEQRREEAGSTEHDNILRCLYTPAGRRAGWMGKALNGRWVHQPKDDVKSALLALGHKKAEAEIIVGGAILKAWELVNLPFQPEYPGNRRWNHGAAQYRFQPIELVDDQVPYHPHWDKVLQHIGQDLTPAIRKLSWTERANIKSGSDYLLAWVACLLRDPFEPLPYLFLFGPENSGKSILHEALSLLMTTGVTFADRALTSKNDFNGELANAVLCVVEEKNISLAGQTAHNRIKEWVTGRTISIRKMKTDSYSQPNTTHWIQCANRKDACPIFPGDTRITMIYVPDLVEDIPKKILLGRLEEEASHFMRTLTDLQLPPVAGRLRLPVVATDHKQQAERLAQDALEEFMAEHCHEVPGAKVLFAEFHEAFHRWLPSAERQQWSKIKTSRMIPARFPVGAGTANKKYIGNLAWERPGKLPPDVQRWIAVGGKLVLEGD